MYKSKPPERAQSPFSPAGILPLTETNKQDQRAADGALAIQSGRDTTINQGLSPDDMKQIIEALAAQLPTYTALARGIVDDRLKDFEQHILERFASSKSARPDSFKDPDFQYLLTRAQHAYARSGEPPVRDILVDLITERSKQTDRNRLALSLNEAVEKAAVLTKNEFAELSFVYLAKYTMNHGIGNLPFFGEYLNTYFVPLLKDISEIQSSYSYLEAQSCANISMGSADLGAIFRGNYGGVLSKGFEVGQLQDHLPDGKKSVFDGSGLIIPCLNDSSKCQFRALSRSAFEQSTKSLDVAQDALINVWNLFEGTMWSNQEIIANVTRLVPEIAEMFRLWDSTPLKHLTLTSVGIAIAHANLVRTANFNADLSIWIK